MNFEQLKKKSNEFYNKAPDTATISKVIVVSYYASLFFSILASRPEKKIYFDPFAGKGIFVDGFKSVPYRVLSAASKIDNIEFIFNDLIQTENLKDFIINSDLIKHKDHCKFLSMNAEDLVLDSYLDTKSIVLAYIDSFSQMLVYPSYVAKILKRKFSDVIVFININEIYRFHSIAKGDQERHIKEFFGGQQQYDDIRKNILESSLSELEKTKLIIKDYIKRVSLATGCKIYGLPIIFRQNHEDSRVNNIIIIMTKNPTGLNPLLNSFSTKIPGGSGDRDLNFYVIDQHLNVYENEIADYVPLFNLDFEDAKKFLCYIPKEKECSINADSLIEKIRMDFYQTHGYYSCISDKYIKKLLKELEDNHLINVFNIDGSNRSRQTFGPRTVFYENN